MFYGQFILAKKGPLAKIWLAAHLERKLSRQIVFETDVGSVVNEVIRPKIKMSLRTNGHLMLGIVRIYAKKAEYILHDLIRAQRIFHHFAENQPQQRVRRVPRQAAPNVSTIEEEDEDQGYEIQIPNRGEFNFPPGPEYNRSAENIDITLDEQDNMFSSNELTYIDQIFEAEANDNFDDLLNADIERINLSRAGSEIRDTSGLETARLSIRSNDMMQTEQDPNVARYESKIDSRFRGSDSLYLPIETDQMDVDPLDIPPDVINGFEPELETQKSDSNIELQPLTESQIRDALAEQRPQRRRRRARVQIADNNISLENDEMQRQMENISDIVTEISLAPPTKQLMNAKIHGSLNHIFKNPATHIFMNPDLMKIYSDHCVEKPRPLSDVPTAEQVLDSMGLSPNAQVGPEDAEINRFSRASMNRQSRTPAPQEDFNQSLFDDELFDNQNKSIFAEPDEFNVPPLVDMSMENEYAEEDVENVNPLAGPPPKRSRTEQEIRADEQRVKRSTKALFNLIKSEVIKKGQQKINFNELVFPEATTKEQVEQLAPEQRRAMAKSAAHKFYALLELRKVRAVQVEQSEAFQPIFVTLSTPIA